MAFARNIARPGIILLVLSLLLLINEPSSKLASGQLEAVGAVLSVVPVTSILATAGLVGVKLAALSRILQALGYDRAYLAQGGPGTANQPIGLHTNYAYMFPYAPGLNISVRGEHDYGRPSSSSGSSGQQSVASPPANRKIYPSMVVPGDYERQERPFRGSDTLKKIFQSAGIQLHLPNRQQQQQIQQQFHQYNAQPGKPTLVIELPRQPAAAASPAPTNNLHHQQQQHQQPLGFSGQLNGAVVAGEAPRQPQPQPQQQQLQQEPRLDQTAGGGAPPTATASLAEKLTTTTGQQQRQQAPQPQDAQAIESFGMPAVNIHSVRRRRRRRRRRREVASSLGALLATQQ